MGMSLSCPLGTVDDLDSRFESFLVRSLSFGDDDGKTAHRSASFNGRESETMLKSFGSGRMIVDGSPKAPKLNDAAMVRSPRHASCREVAAKLISPRNLSQKNSPTIMPESGNERYMAAVRLQKTYKSFRTRRQLADCAVLVEQRWWKLLDFAELKRSSVSFFDIEKPETAVSRWARARTRAAKVGKGLSKDEKARKLALQHWLEAIDPRHRYGHNLQFYYVKWLQCESKQPFFYWLDIGEGREVNLEKCPRTKLQSQCIKYLGPMERKEFEVMIENGRLKYKQSGSIIDTREGPADTKWIFVLSVSKILYVGQKKKGTFQHSSFLAGGATLSAGRLEVEDGILKAVWPHSGHYLPTEENFEEFMSFLNQHDVDLSVVQKAPCDEDEISISRKESIRTSISEPDFNRSSEQNNCRSYEEKMRTSKNYSKDAENSGPLSSRRSRRFQSKIAFIQIPNKDNILELFKQQQPGPNWSTESEQTPVDGYETAEESLSDTEETEYSVSKHNLFDEDQEEEDEEPVPAEKIIKRINSHKGMRSYQLAHQLTCRWTTGAGPRIGCVRDYPSELQARALEEVNLSPRPRSTFASPRICSSPRNKSIGPSSLCRESSAGKSKNALASEPVVCAQAVTPRT